MLFIDLGGKKSLLWIQVVCQIFSKWLKYLKNNIYMKGCGVPEAFPWYPRIIRPQFETLC